MAIKKSELYSSIWRSCDELRGGMDASQYKDYVLVLLFVKYVSDRYAGQRDAMLDVPKGGSFADMAALQGEKEIGEKINKVIAKLAEANNLKGISDQTDFNDDDKLGNLHSADDWEELLLPEGPEGAPRQQKLCKQVVFRADAAFAKPEIYEALEERGVKYANRIPSNDNLEQDIAELQTRELENGAAVGEDRQAFDQARPVLLAAAGGESSDAATVWKHGAADRRAALADRIERGGGQANRSKKGGRPRGVIEGGQEAKMEILAKKGRAGTIARLLPLE